MPGPTRTKPASAPQVHANAAKAEEFAEAARVDDTRQKYVRFLSDPNNGVGDHWDPITSEDFEF